MFKGLILRTFISDAMNDAVRNKFQDQSQRIYSDSLRKKLVNGGLGMNGLNGTIANGHIPRNHQKMNINVNPLSEVESVQSTEGSNYRYTVSYSKTCVKRPLKNRQNKDLYDKW